MAAVRFHDPSLFRVCVRFLEDGFRHFVCVYFICYVCKPSRIFLFFRGKKRELVIMVGVKLFFWESFLFSFFIWVPSPNQEPFHHGENVV